jgi:hypothetical protein
MSSYHWPNLPFHGSINQVEGDEMTNWFKDSVFILDHGI